MAFGNFTSIAQVQTEYQIHYTRIAQLIQPRRFDPSANFTQTFTTLSQLIDVYASEDMRKQAVVFPMLVDVYQHFADHFVLWSGEYIAAPDDERLNGYPDYLVAGRSPLGFTVMEQPYLIVVEAKEDDFTKGWGQCLAAMVASQRINDNHDLTFFGIVTNGQSWQFGQLRRQHFEQEDAAIDRADAFGYLDTIFTSVAQSVNP